MRWRPLVPLLARATGLRRLTTMKLSGDQLAPLTTPEVKTLADIFQRHGFQLRLAGGAVRDMLSGKVPEDLDFATTATPEQMKEMFTKEEVRMINAKGEKHGTITARINDAVNMEVTTLRVDVVNHGRHADVQFTTDWQLDAGRRDLTVNAMFLELDGTVHDYFNGIEDLKHHRVRFVGEPATRIQEDYLRILRYFRFYGRLVGDPHDLAHEEKALHAVRENVVGLAQISGERIWSELRRVAVGRHHCELVCLMQELGVLQYAGFPEKPDIEEYKLVCERMSQVAQPQAITMLVALLRTGEEMLDLHARLKLSAFERDLGIFIITHRHAQLHPQPLKPYQQLLVDYKGSKKVGQQYVVEVLRYHGEHQLAEQFASWEMPRFPVTGVHLKAAGVQPGRMYSRVFERLRAEWVDSDFRLSERQMVERIPHVLEELGFKPK